MAISRRVEHFKDIAFFTEEGIKPDKDSASSVYRHIPSAIIERGDLQLQLNCRWSVNMMVGIGVDRKIPAVAITRDGFRVGELSNFMDKDYYLLEEVVKRNGTDYTSGTRTLVGIGIPQWGEYFSFVNRVDIEEPSVVKVWRRMSEYSKDLWYVTVEPGRDLLTSLRGHLRISRPRNP